MSLSTYLNPPQTELFEKFGVFFAFSQKQFDEQKKEGVKYSSMGAGMICPSDNCQHVRTEMDRIYKEAIQKDLEANGKQSIIRRELDNHECDYTGCCQDVVEALADYGITQDEIWRVFTGRSCTSS